MTATEMPRYVVAVRAPKSGIPGMGDGSWHIVTDTVGNLWAEKRKAVAMIPYIVSAGGELVMYEVDRNNRVVGGAPICIGRSGTESKKLKLPEASEINAINELISNEVHTKSREYTSGGVYGYERLPQTHVPMLSLHARLRQRLGLRPSTALAIHRHRKELSWLGGSVAAVAAFAVSMAVFTSTPQVSGTAPRIDAEVRILHESDFEPGHLEALRGGAFQAIRHVKDDPDTMEVVRIYPEPDGRDRVDVLGRFPARHYDTFKKRITVPSSIRWFDPATVKAYKNM